MCFNFFFFWNFEIKLAIFTASYNIDIIQVDKTTQKEIITFQCDLVLEQNLLEVELMILYPIKTSQNYLMCGSYKESNYMH